MDTARPLTIALALLAGAASAHEVETPKREALAIAAREVRLTVAYLVPQGDLAASLRAVFDRDHDGRIAPPEQRELAAHVAREALLKLHLTLDELPLEMKIARLAVDASGSGDAPIALSVELVSTRPLVEGAHTIALEDRYKDPRVVIPVEVTLAPEVTWRTRPAPYLTVDGDHSIALEIQIGR